MFRAVQAGSAAPEGSVVVAEGSVEAAAAAAAEGSAEAAAAGGSAEAAAAEGSAEATRAALVVEPGVRAALGVEPGALEGWAETACTEACCQSRTESGWGSRSRWSTIHTPETFARCHSARCNRHCTATLLFCTG